MKCTDYPATEIFTPGNANCFENGHSSLSSFSLWMELTGLQIRLTVAVANRSLLYTQF